MWDRCRAMYLKRRNEKSSMVCRVYDSYQHSCGRLSHATRRDPNMATSCCVENAHIITIPLVFPRCTHEPLTPHPHPPTPTSPRRDESEVVVSGDKPISPLVNRSTRHWYSSGLGHTSHIATSKITTLTRAQITSRHHIHQFLIQIRMVK